MATIDESTEDKPNLSPPPPPPSHHFELGKPLGETAVDPWIDYAVQHALIAQKTIVDTLESTISVTKSRLDQVMSTSSAHLQMTIDSLQDLKSEYNVYEDIAFGKIKEGIFLAASHPFLTSGVVLGSGLLVMKRPRRALYYNTLRLFVNEEALLAKADAKVNELRKSVDLLKAETKKMEEVSLVAEKEMIRGRTKLRQAGKQIQGVIDSAYKIERQAGGLKDILKELPGRDQSKFRSQVSSLALQAKRERKALGKEVTKISNYGISV